jgi:hypothetical protein
MTASIIVRAHQQAATGKGGPKIRRWGVRGGLTTKIHCWQTRPEGQKADAILADKACDSNNLREKIAAMTAEAVIPCRRQRQSKGLHPARHRYPQAPQPDTIAAASTSPTSFTASPP